MKNFFTLANCVVLTACVATYTVPAGKPTAELRFEVSTDSTGTTTKPGYIVSTFEDPNCSTATDGTRLLTIKSKGPIDVDVAGPIRVVAGDPLTLAMKVSEVRLGQNRQCSFTATFTPSVAQSYTVRFVSTDQALACGMRVFDAAGKEVAQKEPANSCLTTFAGAVKNGGAGILDWKWTVRSK
jgi:hypothetical protein